MQFSLKQLQLTVRSPAKLNLHLAVLDKRPDGFHDLESFFLALNFGDILHFEVLSGEKTIEITMEGTEASGFNMPMENNIIFKTILLFRDKTGFSQGINVRVEKNIPIGSGLGGGSSNAASTLLALNRFAGFPLNRAELLEIAADLGSDVPFFIYETAAAWVTGRGEYIEPLAPPNWFFVLVNPGFSSDTAAAFRLLDEYRKENPSHEVEAPYSSFSNDFLPVFPEHEKEVYNSIISRLRELGADFSNISGSGSTCFGVFMEKAQAEKAAKVMCSKWDFVVTAVINDFHCE